MFTVALIGNPNCGKTTLFNNLTGSQAHVGNWPGVTVEKREGIYRKRKAFPEDIDIVDLPGIYSLSPYTPEEVVSRDFLLKGKPDVVINVVDSSNLGRNLFLTSQLLEMDIPVVMALNFMDVVEKRGDTIDIDLLSKKLGIPVVPVVAYKARGMYLLAKAAYALKGTHRKGIAQFTSPVLRYTLEQVTDLVQDSRIDHPLFIASKLLEQDAIVTHQYPELAKKADALIAQNEISRDKTTVEEMISDERYKYIEQQISPCYHRSVKAPKFTFSDRIDKVVTNRFLGLPIFLVVMYIVFSLVFSKDFLYLGAMGVKTCLRPFYEWADPTAYNPATDAGLPSIGIFLQDSLDYLLNGLLVDALRSGLAAASAPAWVASLLCDGVLNSVFTVITFLPLIVLLTLFIQILENSGYMARVAFVFDRFLRVFGISGRCVVPLISCFGCAVPGIMGTRTIDNTREKVLTISLTPFFACGAKLPVFMAVGTQIIQVLTHGRMDGGLVAFILYAIGVLVAILAGYFSNTFLIQGESSPFIMEFPPYLVPQPKAVLLALWDETKRFLKRAGTVIAGMSLVLWFLQNFTWNWTLTEDMSTSIIASLGQFVQPFFLPLGFAKGADGWKYIVASFTGIIAKEQVVATMTSLGILTSKMTAEEIGITVPAAFSFLTYNLLTWPCIAAISTAKGELKSKKNFHFVLAFWFLTAYLVSAFVYGVGSLSLRGTPDYGVLEIVMNFLALALAILFVVLFALNAFYRNRKGKNMKLSRFQVDDPGRDAINALMGSTETDLSSGDSTFFARATGASDAGKKGKKDHSCCD